MDAAKAAANMVIDGLTSNDFISVRPYLSIYLSIYIPKKIYIYGNTGTEACRPCWQQPTWSSTASHPTTSSRSAPQDRASVGKDRASVRQDRASVGQDRASVGRMDTAKAAANMVIDGLTSNDIISVRP